MPQSMLVAGTEYSIERLLGRGKGGYSYLAADPAGTRVVVKQIHHEPCAYYTFGDKFRSELRDYATLRGLRIAMPRLLAEDADTERLVKEYVEGFTVYDLVLRDALPTWCRAQMLEIADKLRTANLNIDYFPTNFIPSAGRLYYVDYECNPYDPKWDFAHWGDTYWHRSSEFLAHAKAHPDHPTL